MLVPHYTRMPEQGEELTSVVLIVLIVAHWRLPLRVVIFLVTAEVTIVWRRFSIDDWLDVPMFTTRNPSVASLATDSSRALTSLAFPFPSSLSRRPLHSPRWPP